MAFLAGVGNVRRSVVIVARRTIKPRLARPLRIMAAACQTERFSLVVMGGSIFVLFVDDDAAFADAVARSLESAGMRTVVALGSVAALDAFDSHAIDVVVTDIKLPAGEAHGLALSRMIRNKKPRVPIILMTTYSELLEGEIALPGAALCKPIELAELCRSIRVRLAQ